MSGEAFVPIYNALGPWGYFAFCMVFVAGIIGFYFWSERKSS